jgi:glycosyltransferase involved in cell wall biosynthesis
MSQGKAPRISIIICTRDRADSLRRCLESFEGIEIPPEVSWELIVVDNGSSDHTRSVVEKAAEAVAPMRFVQELRAGASYARNTGADHATGDILAFTDDDCIADPHWIAGIMREFESDPSLGALGGRVELFDARDKPVTIATMKERVVFSSPCDVFNSIHGCNVAFSRAAFDDAGRFDVRFGPGTKLLAAEDLDLLYRVSRKGFKIVYCPEALVYHNHGRRTEAEVRRLTKSYTVGRGAFYCKHVLQKDRYALKFAYWEARGLAGMVVSRLRDPGRRKGAVLSLGSLLLGMWHYLAIRTAPARLHTGIGRLKTPGSQVLR